MTALPTTAELFASTGSGVKLFFNRDSTIGETFSGEVIDATPVQARDFDTNEPKSWDDGSPMMQLSITLRTTLRSSEIEDDNGDRRYFCPWWGPNRQALTQAVQKSGDAFVQPGAHMSITFSGLAEAKGRLSPAKLFSFSYTPPPSATEKLMSGNGNGHAAVAPPAAEAQLDLVAQARATQKAAATPPAAAADDPAAAMAKVQNLIAAGIDAATIHQLVPSVSMAAISAIANL